MKTLIFVVGAPAVGKMTVGKALSERTGCALFHNHMSIELALRFFEFGSKGFRVVSETIRTTIFDAVADSDKPGLIFTFAWAFDVDEDRQYLERLIDRWHEKTEGGQVMFLELHATDEAKRLRNVHPDRLAEKASKRDIDESEKRRQAHERKYRFTSERAFPFQLPHLSLDNTQLSPDAVADRFLEEFVDIIPAVR